MKLKNLVGETFGRLTVMCQVQNTGGRATWFCQCSCGGSKIIDSKALRTGKTASCGCLKATHGLSGSHPQYGVWLSMRARCNTTTDASYKHYGARGIKVCERWDDFTAFIEDMGPRPPKASIERRNNDGNYEPSNCYWATQVEQMSNTRRTKLLTAKGRTMTQSAWARELNTESATLISRLKRGWSEEDTCTIPV